MLDGSSTLPASSYKGLHMSFWKKMYKKYIKLKDEDSKSINEDKYFKKMNKLLKKKKEK